MNVQDNPIWSWMLEIMVNPQRYDRQDVVRRASELFWTKGYHATSARDLQAALDMRPGSIYSAFGSKEGLYQEALIAYVESAQARVEEAFAGSSSVVGALKQFVKNTLVEEKEYLASKVCFMTRTLTELGEDQSKAKVLCTELQERFEQQLAQYFRAAIKNGEVTGNLKPIEYARLFQIQFSGMRTYLLRDDSPRLVDRLIDQMFKVIESI